jgi:hypothetical protein
LAGDTDTFVAMVRSQVAPVLPGDQWKRRVPRAKTATKRTGGATIETMHFDESSESGDSDDDYFSVHAAAGSDSGSDSDTSNDSVDDSDNYF